MSSHGENKNFTKSSQLTALLTTMLQQKEKRGENRKTCCHFIFPRNVDSAVGGTGVLIHEADVYRREFDLFDLTLVVRFKLMLSTQTSRISRGRPLIDYLWSFAHRKRRLFTANIHSGHSKCFLQAQRHKLSSDRGEPHAFRPFCLGNINDCLTVVRRDYRSAILLGVSWQ